MASTDHGEEMGGLKDLTELSKALNDLIELTPATDDYDIAVRELLRPAPFIESIGDHLTSNTSTSTKARCAQFIAEAAKSEYGRQPLCVNKIVNALLVSLQSADKELCLQSARALGNLCYENDECRELILATNGMNHIEKLLAFCAEKPNSFVQLKAAACGFLHNLLNGNESCQKAALASAVLTNLRKILELNASNKTICSFCMMSISSLAEVEGGRDAICQADLVGCLLKLFVNTNIKDTDEFLLSLLSTLTSESDAVKKQVAESSADMHLMSVIGLLSSSSDDDEQALVKAASELLVLVLTGDESMKIWFDGGNGFVFTSVCQWLTGSNAQLLQSAAFAIGNFARDDDNSHIIIHRGINLELCKCLDQLFPHREDARTGPTIHAILSALRNLAIAPTNKLQLLQQGVLAHLLPYMDCENTVVTSKLVGVLRLLIDKNAQYATILGKTGTVLEQLVKFGHSDYNMLLKGESTRCLAWIIKNTMDEQVLQSVLDAGVMPHLIFLVSSDHAVMQNEGLISLVLLVSTIPDSATEAIKSSDLLATIKQLYTKETLPSVEVLQNSLMLLHQLMGKGVVEEIQSLSLESELDRVANKYTNVEAITSLVRSIKNNLQNTA